MLKIYYDMLYLSACGVNNIKPSEKCLDAYRTENKEKSELFNLSCKHFLDTLIGMTLQKSGVSVSAKWNENISKSIRKTILFNAERSKLLAFMEKQGIWHMSLKGIILKDFYPDASMRQMSDNDILFDSEYADTVKKYMLSNGYKEISSGKGNHDVYKKPPVYNFELHRSLYGFSHKKGWKEYYSNIYERLIQDGDSIYSFHMTDEDFYIYITSHAYKHYSKCGTGIRTLLDFYVYLKEKKSSLNFSYIQSECEKLGISEFETESRKLCEKVFSPDFIKKYQPEKSENIFSDDEKKMLMYYFESGVYGNLKNQIEHNLNKCNTSKLKYALRRLFPDRNYYANFPLLNKYKILIPFFWLYRIGRTVFSKRRRKFISSEIKILKKTKSSGKNKKG